MHEDWRVWHDHAIYMAHESVAFAMAVSSPNMRRTFLREAEEWCAIAYSFHPPKVQQ